jgi:hypothetical protein
VSATRTKLEEARFFLSQMEAAQFQHPTFAYHLSAFVSAARSVLWVMRHEFHEVPGWDTWYELCKASAEDRTFLKSLNDLRVAAVKFATPPVQNHLEVQIPKEGVTPELVQFLTRYAGRQVSVTIDPSGTRSATAEREDSIEFTGLGARLFPVVAEFPDENVVSVCHRYVQWLSALVLECEARFGV